MNPTSAKQNRMFAWSLHLVGVAVVALVAGGFYGLVYQPLQRKQTENQTRLEQLDQLLVSTGAEGAEYRRLRTQLDDMKRSVEEVRIQLSGSSSARTVTEQFSKLAASVNLDVLDYEVGVTEFLPTHSQTEIEFSCLGSYASICRFLDRAEQFTKTTKLSTFELAAHKKTSRYPVQLTFVWYSEAKSNDTQKKRGVL